MSGRDASLFSNELLMEANQKQSSAVSIGIQKAALLEGDGEPPPLAPLIGRAH